MDFFDSLSRQGGPQKCGPPCLRPIVDRKEALADKTRGAAYQGKSNRLALSEGLNTAGAFMMLNTLLRGVGKTAEQSGALVDGMQRDLAVVTSGGGALAKSNAWSNLATSCGAARSALSSAGRMADHAVVKEMQNFLDVLGGTAAQAGGGNTPAAQKPGLSELFPQQEAPINKPWSAGLQTGAPGNPPLFLRGNSLDEWNKGKADNVLVRAHGGGDEHIDSTIEQMYNDTEMDHSPQTEEPEPIPPQDQQIIDDEWSGNIEQAEIPYSPEQIKKYADSKGIRDLSDSAADIFKICRGRKELAESLVDAIPESYCDEGLSLTQRVEKHTLPQIPDAESLSMYQTRIWYRWQESLISSRLDYSKPMEDVARQAFEMRNAMRTQAREAMVDTDWAQHLKEEEENQTFEGLVRYYQERNYYGDALWQKIIDSSMSSRRGVDKLYGL